MRIGCSVPRTGRRVRGPQATERCDRAGGAARARTKRRARPRGERPVGTSSSRPGRGQVAGQEGGPVAGLPGRGGVLQARRAAPGPAPPGRPRRTWCNDQHMSATSASGERQGRRPRRVHPPGQPVGHHPALVGPGRPAEVEVAVGADGRAAARRRSAASAMASCHRGLGTPPRRQVLERRGHLGSPLGQVALAPPECLVERQVHARRHGPERAGLEREVATGLLGPDPRAVEVAQRHEGERPAVRALRSTAPGPTPGPGRDGATERSVRPGG